MVSGGVELTIPEHWEPPTQGTVDIMPEMPFEIIGQMVTVDNVSLLANHTLTFVYTGNVQPEVGHCYICC